MLDGNSLTSGSTIDTNQLGELLMNFLQASMTYVLIILGVIVLFYIVSSIILSIVNKKKFGKGTALAWVPIARDYLAGKLAFGTAIGILMVVLELAPTILTYLKLNISPIIIGIIFLVSALLNLVAAIIVLIQLFKKGTNANETKTENTQNNAPVQDVAQPAEPVVEGSQDVTPAGLGEAPVETVGTPVTEEVVNPIPEVAPVTEEVVNPISEVTPVTEEVVNPISEVTPVTEEVVNPIPEVTPVTEEVVNPIPEVTPVTEEVVNPISEVTPVTEEVVNPILEVAPVTEEVVSPVEETPMMPEVGPASTDVENSQELLNNMTVEMPNLNQITEETVVNDIPEVMPEVAPVEQEQAPVEAPVVDDIPEIMPEVAPVEQEQAPVEAPVVNDIPEVMPEVAPVEIQPEGSSEVPEVNEEVITPVTDEVVTPIPEVIPEVAPVEIQPEGNMEMPELTPEVNEEVITPVTDEVITPIPEVMPEVAPVEIQPEGNMEMPELTPDVSNEVITPVTDEVITPIVEETVQNENTMDQQIEMPELNQETQVVEPIPFESIMPQEFQNTDNTTNNESSNM